LEPYQGWLARFDVNVEDEHPINWKGILHKAGRTILPMLPLVILTLINVVFGAWGVRQPGLWVMGGQHFPA